MAAKSNPNNAFLTQKSKSTINGKIRRKKQKLSYKKDFPNYGNIFSDKIKTKKSKLTAPPILRTRKISQKHATPQRVPKAPLAKKASLPVRDAAGVDPPKRLKKELSYGTSISINSSFSTAQNMNGFNNSNCENKLRKPKRGVLTVEGESQKMFNKYSHKHIPTQPRKRRQRNCDSERIAEADKELYLAEQPVQCKYDTQQLIERIEYDKRYSKEPSRKREKRCEKKLGEHREQRKKKIDLKNSFESDKEDGFGPLPGGPGLKAANDNTFSFNNLSAPKFSAKAKPILKDKRASRLRSDNKRASGVRNVFKDDDSETGFCEKKATGADFKKKSKARDANVFRVLS